MKEGLKALLFDLDGTLLMMHAADYGAALQKLYKDTFREYLGWESEFTHRCWSGGIHEINGNTDANRTLEEAFYQGFEREAGMGREEFMEPMLEFNTKRFDEARTVARWQCEGANEMLANAKEKGYMIVLATAPRSAGEGTFFRLNWAGIDHKLFDYISVRENTCFVKPRKEYYTELLEKLGLKAEECCMFGNDVPNDLVEPYHMGMQLFWQTDWAMNNGAPVPPCEMGGFQEMKEWVDHLPDIRR